ncbi:hypothetical protein OF83DRAFT_1177715 [Amylostereum chailletii]|nr:hypothetical protein OF83DRAFT_1177715 [Amylostereum chailletii]
MVSIHFLAALAAVLPYVPKLEWFTDKTWPDIVFKIIPFKPLRRRLTLPLPPPDLFIKVDSVVEDQDDGGGLLKSVLFPVVSGPHCTANTLAPPVCYTIVDSPLDVDANPTAVEQALNAVQDRLRAVSAVEVFVALAVALVLLSFTSSRIGVKARVSIHLLGRLISGTLALLALVVRGLWVSRSKTAMAPDSDPNSVRSSQSLQALSTLLIPNLDSQALTTTSAIKPSPNKISSPSSLALLGSVSNSLSLPDNLSTESSKSDLSQVDSTTGSSGYLDAPRSFFKDLDSRSALPSSSPQAQAQAPHPISSLSFEHSKGASNISFPPWSEVRARALNDEVARKRQVAASRFSKDVIQPTNGPGSNRYLPLATLASSEWPAGHSRGVTTGQVREGSNVLAAPPNAPASATSSSVTPSDVTQPTDFASARRAYLPACASPIVRQAHVERIPKKKAFGILKANGTSTPEHVRSKSIPYGVRFVTGVAGESTESASTAAPPPVGPLLYSDAVKLTRDAGAPSAVPQEASGDSTDVQPIASDLACIDDGGFTNATIPSPTPSAKPVDPQAQTSLMFGDTAPNPPKDARSQATASFAAEVAALGLDAFGPPAPRPLTRQQRRLRALSKTLTRLAIVQGLESLTNETRPQEAASVKGNETTSVVDKAPSPEALTANMNNPPAAPAATCQSPDMPPSSAPTPSPVEAVQPSAAYVSDRASDLGLPAFSFGRSSFVNFAFKDLYKPSTQYKSLSDVGGMDAEPASMDVQATSMDVQATSGSNDVATCDPTKASTASPKRAVRIGPSAVLSHLATTTAFGPRPRLRFISDGILLEHISHLPGDYGRFVAALSPTKVDPMVVGRSLAMALTETEALDREAAAGVPPLGFNVVDGGQQVIYSTKWATPGSTSGSDNSHRRSQTQPQTKYIPPGARTRMASESPASEGPSTPSSLALHHRPTVVRIHADADTPSDAELSPNWRVAAESPLAARSKRKWAVDGRAPTMAAFGAPRALDEGRRAARVSVEEEEGKRRRMRTESRQGEGEERADRVACWGA